MKIKTFVLMIVAIVLIGGAIGGAFIGGVAVGKDQQQDDGTLPTDIPGGTGFSGRGTIGTITKIENGVITLTTQNGGNVVVNTTSSTTVQKMETVNLSEIAVGESITVTGETQSDSSVIATNISVMPEGINPVPLPQTNP
jgi:hypothetical protein